MKLTHDFPQFLSNWTQSWPFGYKFHPPLVYILENYGKLLRPNLVLSIAQDLNQLSQNHYWLALSIELHHSYTLVHDDLPCMDNDDYRRGKPTLHKVFGEAQALLVGDILLAKSFEILTKINSPELINLIKIYSYAIGSKGLILGQKLDLDSLENNVRGLNSHEIIRMYELKTSRLFQLAMVSSILLTKESKNLTLIKNACKLGSVCGILFQLLDDYQDWHQDKKSDFNFFKLNEVEAQKYLILYKEKFNNLKNKLSLTLPKTVEFLEKNLL